MKKREFTVPTEIISDFASQLLDHELSNEITGTTEEGDIIIEIQYEKGEREAVLDLMELVDEQNAENEE